MRTYFCKYEHDPQVVGVTTKGECRACSNAQMRRYRKRYPIKALNNILKHNYGIGIEDFDCLSEMQKGLCGGCHAHQSQFKKRFSVDHDHKTNRIRGLLCSNCNTAIGLVYDNIETLRRLAVYLQAPSLI